MCDWVASPTYTSSERRKPTSHLGLGPNVSNIINEQGQLTPRAFAMPSIIKDLYSANSRSIS